MKLKAGRIADKVARRKRRIEKRLQAARDGRFARMMSGAPAVLGTAGLKYELADRTQAIVYGGVPLMLRVARESGLIDAIDRDVPILKWRCPYYESDHVLNLAMNALCEGTCLEHIEQRRNDEAFLNAVGADSIPDPTTAGDFCRRFSSASVRQLLDTINRTRLNVWKRQPKEFFHEALVDMDGTLTVTTGACQEGMDISYQGEWDYHPLVVSLANTGEVLSIVNTSGNRPREEGAADEADRAIALCREAGYQVIRLRGDTAFSQTEHLDRWDNAKDVRFQFGYDARPNLIELAENLDESAWQTLTRPGPARTLGGRGRPGGLAHGAGIGYIILCVDTHGRGTEDEQWRRAFVSAWRRLASTSNLWKIPGRTLTRSIRLSVSL